MASSVTYGDMVAPSDHPVLGAEETLHAALMYMSLNWAITAGPGLDSSGVCWCSRRGKEVGPNPECRNPGKHAYKGWGNPERRTMTEQQARLLWSPDNARWKDIPVDQVFIVPYLSGLVVADVDNEEAWAARPVEERPETLYQLSGSGRGGHRLYTYDWDLNEENPPSLPGRMGGGAGEIKFRGIIAAAPSVHKSGGRYKWANWGTPIVAAPKTLIERDLVGVRSEREWAKISDADKSNDWIWRMFQADRAGMASAGNAKSSRPLVLFAAAASMGVWVETGWISEDEVLTELLSASKLNGTFDDYGEEELSRQIQNGIESGRREPRG